MLEKPCARDANPGELVLQDEPLRHLLLDGEVVDHDGRDVSISILIRQITHIEGL